MFGGKRLVKNTVFTVLIALGFYLDCSAQVEQSKFSSQHIITGEEVRTWQSSVSAQEADIILSYLASIEVNTDIFNVTSNDVTSIRNLFFKLSENHEPFEIVLGSQLNNLGILTRDKTTDLRQKTALETSIREILSDYPAMQLEGERSYSYGVSDKDKIIILDLLVALDLKPDTVDFENLTEGQIDMLRRFKYLLSDGSIPLFDSDGILTNKNANVLKGKITNIFNAETEIYSKLEDVWVDNFIKDLVALAPQSTKLTIEPRQVRLDTDQVVYVASPVAIPRPRTRWANPQAAFYPEVEIYIHDDSLQHFLARKKNGGFAPPPEKEIRWTVNPVMLCFEGGIDLENEFIDGQLNGHPIIDAAAKEWEKVSGVVIELKSKSECDAVNLQVPRFNLTSNLASRVGLPVEYGFSWSSNERVEYYDNKVTYRISKKRGGFASADGLGTDLADRSGLVFKIQYSAKDTYCGIDVPSGNKKCAFADALHEIGHLLGFSHDHISTNAPLCEGKKVSHEVIDLKMTYYDPNSIMNYCNSNRWDGKLSKADICSVQVAYPKKGFKRPWFSDCDMLAKAAVIVNSG